MFEALGIPVYSVAGFEADDILGTIVEKTKKQKDIEIVIASGDMDTLQLVDGDKVTVFTLKKGINDTILYNEQAVLDRFGFGPDRIADYKGLRGDPSDNIIGIKGIGEKTATDLMLSFGGIEDIYKALEKDPQKLIDAGIKQRIVQLLSDNKEEAEFSKMLATIRRDAPIDWVLPEKTFTENLSIEKVSEMFAALEFRKLTDRLRTALGQEAETVERIAPDETKREDIPDEEFVRACIGLWVLDSNLTDPSLEDIYAFTKTRDFANAYTIIQNEIQKRNLSFVFEQIELPLLPIITDMENYGVKIDTETLGALSATYHEKLDAIQAQIYGYAGQEFNINSPKQLGEIIYDTLGLKPTRVKKTAGGQRSTAEGELLKMKDSHPIIELIMQHRELQKLLSTYIDTIPTLLDDTSRLHTHFVQTGTTTGRMSSQNPNLQNIPIKTELGRNIRDSFVANTGCSLVALDYSQIELRIAAILSDDPKLIGAFQRGEDIHSIVASEVFNVPIEQVEKEMRRKAKVINFGILYGMGVNALRQNLGEDTTRAEAQAFYDTYFEKFSGLTSYINETKANAARMGYTETLFGRRRYFEGLKSKLSFIRASAERMAINAPIQGTQADVIKLAMIEIDKTIKKSFASSAHLILQIHDEVIYEVNNDAIADFVQSAKESMEHILTPEQTKGVPIIANASAGTNWGNMKEV